MLFCEDKKVKDMRYARYSFLLNACLLWIALFFINPILNAQWVLQDSQTNQDFWGISFADENFGYAGGGPWEFTSSCVVSKTENGGENWTIQNPVSFPSCVFGIHAINKDTVFAVGCNASYYHGLILRSFDGGENWSVNNISNTWGFYGIEFPTESIGYTCGWNGRIYKTEDCGNTWVSLVSGSSQAFRRLNFVNENLGFAACGTDHASTNKIYKTTDGTTWSLISNFGGSFIIGGMHFFDENTGVVVGTNGSKAVIKRTIDGGENWDDVLEGNHSYVLESLSFDENEGWTAGKYGSNSGVFRTLDSGETWEINYSELPATPYSVFQYHNVSYIAGTSGMIMKFEDDITKLGENINDLKPAIYPCPTQEKLNITFPKNAIAYHYEIINANGQIVFTGNNNMDKTISININDWQRGFYLMKTWADQNCFSNKIIIN